MKNLLIIIAILLTTSSNAFSLTYKKYGEEYKHPWSDGIESGIRTSEGFYGLTIDDFPNCIKLKSYLTENILQAIKGGVQVRQGLIVYYKSDGNIYNTESGLRDCKLLNGVVGMGLDEGIIVNPNLNDIYFKKENSRNHVYVYEHQSKLWFYDTLNVDGLSASSSNANHIRRAATQEEILHAEKLLKIYRNLDLSSPTAKIYSSLNETINQTEKKQIKKTQEPAPAKKQSESGVAAELERLQKLFNSGAINKDEYQKAKNKVLK
jgi:hypothetical protein